MASWKKSFGTYLKTEDLAGHSVRVVIERISEEELGGLDGGKKETKLVARFYGKEKALVLNRTKCEALETLSGTDETEAWVGLQIILAPGRTKFQGKTVGCIDIKPGGAVRSSSQAVKPNGGARRAVTTAAPVVELPPEDSEGVPELLAEAPDLPAVFDDDIPF